MIQSDCNLVLNALKPIKTTIEMLKIKKEYRGRPLTIGWNDYPFVLYTLSCLRHSMVSSVGPLWNTQWLPWVSADLKALRTVCDVFLFFGHFPIRCSGSGVVLIVSIPDICLLPYYSYLHKYRLTRNTVYCAILSDQIVVGCPLGVPISYYSIHISQPSTVKPA